MPYSLYKMFTVENLIDIFNFTYGNLYVCVAFVVKLQETGNFILQKCFILNVLGYTVLL